MQELAKSWIVLNLVGTASAMGILLFSAAVPHLLLASLGGALADQWGARRILIATQALLSVLAFSLGTLVTLGHIEFWHLIGFAILEGSVLAFDGPAFQLVTPQLVPKQEFQRALALNSVSFHTSRVLGPSIAGLVMAFGGTSMVFWINSISFFGVLMAIASLPFKDRPAKNTDTRPGGMKEVLRYLKNHPLFNRIMLQFVVTMCLVFPLVFTTFRVFLQQEYHLTQQTYGLVLSLPGLGALTGSLSFLLWNPQNPIKALPWGVSGIVVFLLLLGLTHSWPMTVVALVLFSVSMFLSMSSMLVTLQVKVEDHLRGRISALTGMAFIALAPIMSVPIGWLSDHLGARTTMVSLALIFGLLSGWLAWRSRNLKFSSDAPQTA